MRFTVATVVLAACSSYGDGTPPETPVPDRDAGSETGDADAAPEAAVDAGVEAAADADADAPAIDSGTPCNGLPDCARLIFVSSSKGDGSQGGVAGADMECQELANASPHTSGHKFKAWLSQDGAFVQDRITHGLKPYRRVDNIPVATEWSGLISGTLLNPINVDENGLTVPTENVWTATHVGGSGSGQNCNDWGVASSTTDGQVGSTTATNGDWTDITTIKCNNSLRIYCIEE